MKTKFKIIKYNFEISLCSVKLVSSQILIERETKERDSLKHHKDE